MIRLGTRTRTTPGGVDAGDDLSVVTEHVVRATPNTLIGTWSPTTTYEF